MKPDHETIAIVTEQQELADLVGHRAWKIARNKLTEKILDLQNAFNIEETDANATFINLQARKMASLILWDFLQTMEGSVSVAKENKDLTKPSYILRMEE